MICRILPHESADGPANMGLDQALLDFVDADPSSAVLRTYEWDEPTLSLGYFQSIRATAEEPRWRGVPVVRRATGGGALWHDRELTYALVVPRSHAMAGRPSLLYRSVHGAIAGALNARGFAAHRRGEVTPDSSRDKPFLCFLDRDSEDVLVSGAKVVGSAQRRRPSAVLQHGSVLLARSRVTPELPGLFELAGHAPTVEDVAGWLGLAVSGLLEVEAREHRLSDPIRERGRELATTVYRDPQWTGRR